MTYTCFQRCAASGCGPRYWPPCISKDALHKLLVDSTTVRAHQHTSGAQKKCGASYWAQPRCLTNKLNVVADALGCLVRVGLIADQCHDSPQALPLLQDLASAFIVADRGYDSDPLVAVLGACVTQAVMPPPHMPCTPRRYDVTSCAQSYQVEQLFSCPKQMCAG
jgi:hypothetical protein